MTDHLYLSGEQLPCVIIPPGNYVIQSVTINPGVPLNVGLPNTLGNVIIMTSSAPQPELGVWNIKPADQGGFHIQNVGLRRNVTSIHLTESNLFLPVVAVTNTPATTYAIQCAGGGEYVIKNVVADQLWTPVPSSDQEVSTIELLPASGSRTQHWNFVPA
ncbi:hypothetical protein JR316_0009649 [Psilocybe cubensis]|uniref:Uncharacterized protein n=2 Tax=Psilocybe cubensis TaxID=181762 RepID=A0ACB8GPE5_PSICU|nr:hypothetical protein JR316_0009649 [Psilocybe cubensis]KAH9477436.1 hypothetical protein JR316_0009649 [Psilocybe cubensis]